MKPIVITESEMSESMFGSAGNIGICRACLERDENVEADLWNGKCHSCDELQLCSVEALLLRGLVDIALDDD